MAKNVLQILDHAERHCKEHGSRLTNKRKLILQALLNSEKALSAYDVIDVCRDDYDAIVPAMSVYRILDFLQEEGLVHKLKLANKFVACSHITCDHAHGVPQFLICGGCQRVEEIAISPSTLDDIEARVSAAGFRLASPQLEMDCLCEACAQ